MCLPLPNPKNQTLCNYILQQFRKSVMYCINNVILNNIVITFDNILLHRITNFFKFRNSCSLLKMPCIISPKFYRQTARSCHGTKRWTDAADVAVEVAVSCRDAGERQRRKTHHTWIAPQDRPNGFKADTKTTFPQANSRSAVGAWLRKDDHLHSTLTAFITVVIRLGQQQVR